MAPPDFRDQSMLRVISVGVAAENKLRNSAEVEVVISEQLTFINGELKSDFKTDVAKGVDSKGKPFEVSVNMANTVNAEWLGDGTNRITPPDLRRGDSVEILQYGEVDKFYWRAKPIPGQSVRKLETVTQTYSNTRDENDNKPTAANSWYSEVNTHDKIWTSIQTNKNDGEDFAYTQQVNAKEGNFVVAADDAGNYIQLNSKEQLLEFANALNSYIHLDKGKLILEADEVIINGRKSIAITAPKATVTITNTKWAGEIGLNGGMAVEGGTGFNCKSAAKFTGDIRHMGVGIGKDHKHRVIKEGQDTNIVTAN